MPENKIIHVRLNNNYLNMLNTILEHEKKYYHFVGEKSDLIRLIILTYYEQTIADQLERKQNENNT